MLPPGSTRRRLERTLNTAYAEGVLSQKTLVHRLELLFDGPLVDPAVLVGDLSARRQRGNGASAMVRVRTLGRKLVGALAPAPNGSPVVLVLDWEGGREQLVIGRNPSCDVVLSAPAVSRQHAQLNFRDGSWTLQDLDSTNGTLVNGARVGSCEIRPGDRIVIGYEQLVVD